MQICKPLRQEMESYMVPELYVNMNHCEERLTEWEREAKLILISVSKVLCAEH